MWAGKVSAKRVVVLAGHLHLNHMSRCRMIRLGGDIRWIGWDANSELAASQHDLIMAFASSEGSEENSYPRPGTEQRKAAHGLFAPSIADFSVGGFMSIINGA